MSESLISEASPRDAVWVLIFLVLAILTYFGSMTNVAGDNSLLLLVIFLVGVVAFVIILPGNRIPQKLYPLAIVTFSFCLIFHVQWLSPYVMGWDAPHEYFVFEGVRSTGHWSLVPDNYNSVLSVTILPTMLQALLAVDDTTIFKTLYPLMFSLVPPVLYLAYKEIVSSKRAFVASLFFASYTAYFYDVSFIGKQEIAELILALLILLTFRGRSHPKSSGVSLAMIVLITGVVASHYSTAYIYISFLLLSGLAIAVLKKRSVVPLTFVALIAIIALAWYSFASGGSALFSLGQFANLVSGTMTTEFFNPASRGSTALAFFGVGVRASLVNSVDLLVLYSIQLFIVAGVIGLWKRHKVVNLEFICYASIALFLVISSIVVPNFASGLNLTRIYQIALIFLSPACVLGGESVFRTLFHAFSILTTRSWRVRLPNSDSNLKLVASIIILLLFFNTGFVNEISGAPPLAFSLGFNRIRESNDQQKLIYLYSAYIPEQDYISARWFSAYMLRNSSTKYVCADHGSRFVQLLVYSGIPLEGGGTNVALLQPGLTFTCGYIYLRYVNVIYGLGDGFEGTPQAIWSTSEITGLINPRNTIYSNGGSSVLT